MQFFAIANTAKPFMGAVGNYPGVKRRHEMLKNIVKQLIKTEESTVKNTIYR